MLLVSLARGPVVSDAATFANVYFCVCECSYAKAWHRLHSALDTIEMRRAIAAASARSPKRAAKSHKSLISHNHNEELETLYGATDVGSNAEAGSGNVISLFDAVRKHIDTAAAKDVAMVLLNLKGDQPHEKQMSYTERAVKLALQLETAVDWDRGPWHFSDGRIASPPGGSLNFALRRSPQKGKYVVATRDLKAGSVVLADLPFACIRVAGRLRQVGRQGRLRPL